MYTCILSLCSVNINESLQQHLMTINDHELPKYTCSSNNIRWYSRKENLAPDKKMTGPIIVKRIAFNCDLYMREGLDVKHRGCIYKVLSKELHIVNTNPENGRLKKITELRLPASHRIMPNGLNLHMRICNFCELSCCSLRLKNY